MTTSRPFPRMCGVVHPVPVTIEKLLEFSRVCGGDSGYLFRWMRVGIFSPRVWGWIGIVAAFLAPPLLFPAYMGVDRRGRVLRLVGSSFPRVCVGVTRSGRMNQPIALFPRVCGGGSGYLFW